MFPKTIVLLCSVATLNYMDSKRLPDLTSNKLVTPQAWKADKVAVLTKFLESEASPNRNITIVAWQRVLNNQGKITNLNTIQLVIPPKLSNSHKEIEAERNDFSDAKINRLKEKLAQAEEEFGLPASASLEEFSEDGKLETLIYTNNDELFVKRRNQVVVYNKTARISQQEVEDFIDYLRPTIFGRPTVSRYDTDGNLLVVQNEVQPDVLDRVDDPFEAAEDIQRAGLQIIVEISKHYSKDKISKQLAVRFNLDFPEYTWRVLVDPVYYHILKDVSLKLDHPDSNTFYFVYGIKN